MRKHILQLILLILCVYGLSIVAPQIVLSLTQEDEWVNLDSSQVRELTQEWQEKSRIDCRNRGGAWILFNSNYVCDKDLAVKPISLSPQALWEQEKHFMFISFVFLFLVLMMVVPLSYFAVALDNYLEKRSHHNRDE
jgi:hypothetical protein